MNSTCERYTGKTSCSYASQKQEIKPSLCLYIYIVSGEPSSPFRIYPLYQWSVLKITWYANQQLYHQCIKTKNLWGWRPSKKTFNTQIPWKTDAVLMNNTMLLPVSFNMQLFSYYYYYCHYHHHVSLFHFFQSWGFPPIMFCIIIFKQFLLWHIVLSSCHVMVFKLRFQMTKAHAPKCYNHVTITDGHAVSLLVLVWEFGYGSRSR